MSVDMDKERGQCQNGVSQDNLTLPVIREVKRHELNECLEVIHKSFRTVADKFGITEENCPKHTTFLPLSALESNMDNGWRMCGLFAGEKIIGYVALSDEGDGVYELHNISVLPEYRCRGFGSMLIEYAKKAVKASGGSMLRLSYIEENAAVKAWYISNGFVHTGTKKFDHLPFTSGYMVWKPERE